MYSLEEVLRDTDGGQGVVSLEDDKLTVVAFLQTVMIIVFTHIFKFTKGDGKRKDGKLVAGGTEDNRKRVFESLREV